MHEATGPQITMDTVAPWARRSESAIQRCVIGAHELIEVELDMSSLLRGSDIERWNAHKIAVEIGALEPDEVREVEGWSPRVRPRPGQPAPALPGASGAPGGGGAAAPPAAAPAASYSPFDPVIGEPETWFECARWCLQHLWTPPLGQGKTSGSP